MILSNIHDAAVRRRLSGHGGRGLAGAAVAFDTTISVARFSGAAAAMGDVVAAIAPAAIKAKFVAELKDAKASGEFPAMAGVNVTALAAGITVTSAAPQQAVVVGAQAVPTAQISIILIIIIGLASVIGYCLFFLRCVANSRHIAGYHVFIWLCYWLTSFAAVIYALILPRATSGSAAPVRP